MQKIILITGCSSGIGYDAAIDLAKRGHRVFASCRKPQDFEKLKAEGLEAVQLDVDSTESINQAFSEIMGKTGGKLDVLINNAGYGQVGALEDVSDEALRAQFSTNVFGLMALTRLAIPVMRRQGQGRIINVSSMLGIISLPFRGAYNASKYAVEGLSDTLRLELKSSGIKVITIEPGPIESRFRDTVLDFSLQKIDMQQSHFTQQYQYMLGEFRQQKTESIFTSTPKAVINKMIHAIEDKNPRPTYRVTFPTHVLALLKRLLSIKMLDRFLLYVSKKELKS